MMEATDSVAAANSPIRRPQLISHATPDSLPAESTRSPPLPFTCNPEPDKSLSTIDIATSRGVSQRKQDQEKEADAGERPQLRSTADVKMFEAFDIETGAFVRCFYTCFDNEHRAWIGQNTGLRKFDLSLEDIVLSLRKIPDEKAFPEAPQQITLAPVVDSAKHFVKRLQIHCISNDFESTLVPRMHIEEAQTLEYPRQHPHPNIVTYYGCVIKRRRIVGIVLKRLRKTLDHHFCDGDASDLNVELLEKQLRSAIAHVHALGLAHNDLNPSNIALDESGQLVVIDWGSCKEFGKELISAGTPGWMDEEYDTSKPEHDLTAIEKIINWIRTNSGTRDAQDPDTQAQV